MGKSATGMSKESPSEGTWSLTSFGCLLLGDLLRMNRCRYAAAKPPKIGPNQNTQWFGHLFITKAGPNERTGLRLAPVQGSYRITKNSQNNMRNRSLLSWKMFQIPCCCWIREKTRWKRGRWITFSIRWNLCHARTRNLPTAGIIQNMPVSIDWKTSWDHASPEYEQSWSSVGQRWIQQIFHSEKTQQHE